jgi:Flp pilus assembly pilin Flp
MSEDSVLQKYVQLFSKATHNRPRIAVQLLKRALRDEHGGEVLEYSLIAGLMVVGAIGAIQCVGTKIVARWSSVNSSM